MGRSPWNGRICSFKYIRILMCFVLILGAIGSPSDEDSESTPTPTSKNPTKQKASQRRERSREQWESAFKEIKAFRVKRANSADRNKGFFSQWKLLLDQPKTVELDPETNMTIVRMERADSATATRQSRTKRFEGFPSWDRILQDWSDDVQEYMDRIEAENSDYPLSTFGTPYEQLKAEAEPKVAKEAKIETTIENSVVISEPKVLEPTVPKKKIKLPVPAPARPGEEVVPHTDISDKSKRIWIVTTAALPWMTGTAVNPLLRAAYMTEGRSEEGGSVTLMLPWLERIPDQEHVYGKDRVFESPEDQDQYIRTWLREKAKLPRASEELKIDWYNAWQNKIENSVYSMGDITALIPEEEVDICILEEPEHLNWYRAPGDSWTTKFKHVVGIIHTNYFVYAQEQPAAFIRAPGMRLLCSWMCRAHCHRVIKLSGTLGQFAPEKELVENVHGVRYSFLESGEAVRDRLEKDATNDPVFGAAAQPKVYFIGKMLWSKGLGSLMELLKYAEESAGTKVHVDMYGGGPDMDAAQARATSLDVDLDFHGPIDHAELALTHKLFINPSTSEVLCTTVAEALAMGKFVLVPSHPSNDFFAQFPNCLTYTNKEEFVGNLYYALTHSPEPLTKDDSYALSWGAATERLEAAASIPVNEANLMNEALSSKEAGIEVTLPKFIDDATGRKLVVNTFIKTRSRYRQFRSRLSQEIQHSNVLPEKAKQRLVSELEKRLDLDIDDILESPKLPLQLSPAELDKRLLELYKNIANGPRGDILRVLAGGQEIGFQDLYIKRRSSKLRRNQDLDQSSLSFGPFSDSMEADDAKPNTASQWVQQALVKNLENSFTKEKSKPKTIKPPKGKKKMEMCIPSRIYSPRRVPLVTSSSQFCPPRSATRSFSLLI